MLIALVAPLLAGLQDPAPAASAGGTDLSYRAYREWEILLPAEQFARVSGGFSLAACKGERFALEPDGRALRVDTDGDGELDTTVSGREDDLGNRSALVTLRGTAADGQEFAYTLRLVDSGAGWHFAASGAMVGAIGDTRIQLIDQDNNGRYDDFGRDAIVVGGGKVASFLSRAIVAGGELYSIEVSPDGTRLDYRPFEGERGRLDLASGLESQAKLVAAVVTSACGRYSFELSRASEGAPVPAGSYRLHGATLGLSRSSVHARPGRSAPIEVAPGARVVWAWGGPLKGELTYARQGDQLVISPDDVTWFGRAGEEYKVWDPVGKSPEFRVLERAAGAELATALFPGST